MKTTSCLRALTVLTLLLVASFAQAASVSSTVNEDNRATTNGTDQNQNVYDFNVVNQIPVPANHPAIVTPAYTFGNSWQSLSSINQITLTLTMYDGNSGTNTGDPSNFDFNNLHFYLGGTLTQGIYSGGIDTGIVLNGFDPGNVDTRTFTLSIDPNTTGASILSALQSGSGSIAGYVVSSNPNDTAAAPNELALANDTNSATTTLTLANVPEPGVCALLGSGLLMLIAPRIRRFRKHL